RFREFLGKATVGLNGKRSITFFSYQLNMGYYGIVEPFEKDSGKEKEDHPMEFETPYHTLLHQAALVKNSIFLGKTKFVATASWQNDQRKELETGDNENHSFLGFDLNLFTLDVKADHTFTNNVSLLTDAQGSAQWNRNAGYGI